MDILRIPGGAQGRSRAVAFGPLVWAVAVSPDKGGDMAAQTRAALAVIDQALGDAGTSKQHLLQATVYITDMNDKAAMDAVWTEWVAPNGWPQRACVQVGLSPGTRVEIAVVAARALPS
jgi:enamine deaminase RidA (YjgF/YER057c/UK114 family)